MTLGCGGSSGPTAGPIDDGYRTGLDSDPDPQPCDQEGAWADGTDFPGKNWATYMEYTIGNNSIYTLYAGQDIDVGTVTVVSIFGLVFVTYQTTDGWFLKETHLHIADSLEGIPQTNKGNPKVGHFRDKMTHDPVVQAYMSHYAMMPEWDYGDTLFIAAHAEVVFGNDCN
jgi:hypothetical protein